LVARRVASAAEECAAFHHGGVPPCASSAVLGEQGGRELTFGLAWGGRWKSGPGKGAGQHAADIGVQHHRRAPVSERSHGCRRVRTDPRELTQLLLGSWHYAVILLGDSACRLVQAQGAPGVAQTVPGTQHYHREV